MALVLANPMIVKTMEKSLREALDRFQSEPMNDDEWSRAVQGDMVSAGPDPKDALASLLGSGMTEPEAFAILWGMGDRDLADLARREGITYVNRFAGKKDGIADALYAFQGADPAFIDELFAGADPAMRKTFVLAFMRSHSGFPHPHLPSSIVADRVMSPMFMDGISTDYYRRIMAAGGRSTQEGRRLFRKAVREHQVGRFPRDDSGTTWQISIKGSAFAPTTDARKGSPKA
jgi:hypothetical protein